MPLDTFLLNGRLYLASIEEDVTTRYAKVGSYPWEVSLFQRRKGRGHRGGEREYWEKRKKRKLPSG